MTISKHTADAVGKKAQSRSTHVIPRAESDVSRTTSWPGGTAHKASKYATARTFSRHAAFTNQERWLRCRAPARPDLLHRREAALERVRRDHRLCAGEQRALRRCRVRIGGGRISYRWLL